VMDRHRAARQARTNPHQLVLDAAAEAVVDAARPDEGAMVEPQVTETEFLCKLITIRSKKSFAEVTDALESLFRMVDLQRLADMTAAGDQAGIHAYFEELSGDHEFSIFFKLDQGSMQRLAGFPINCRFYLIGNAIIVNGLFYYGATAGLGAAVRVCVSQNEGEEPICCPRMDRGCMSTSSRLTSGRWTAQSRTGKDFARTCAPTPPNRPRNTGDRLWAPSSPRHRVEQVEA
jgi:hypothetical protein